MVDVCVMKSPAEHHPEYQEVYLGVILHCLHSELSRSPTDKTANPGYVRQLLTYLAALDTMLDTSELERDIAKDFLDLVQKNQDEFTKRAVQCVTRGIPAIFGENKSVDKQFLDNLIGSSFQVLPKLPAMYINGTLVKGDIDAVRAVGAFCDVLKPSDLPPFCDNIRDEAFKMTSSVLDYTPPVEKASGTQAVLIFLLLTGIIVIIFYFVSKYIFKSNVESDISQEIDNTLNKYYNVQSARNQNLGFQSYKELTTKQP